MGLFWTGAHQIIDYEETQASIAEQAIYERNRKTEEELNTATEEGPELHLLEQEGKEELYRALKSLKEEYQEVLLLTELEGMKLKEAARVMGKTLPQIKVLAHRARKALLLALQK